MGNSNTITVGVVAAIIGISFIAVFVVLPTTTTSDINSSASPTKSPDTHTYDNSDDLQNAESSPVLVPSYMENSDYATPDGSISLIDIFEKTEPGVVRINVLRAPDVLTHDNGVGSGFVYDKQGHIVTNMHVIQSAESIRVKFLDGHSYSAVIVGEDVFTDIAVLRVNADESILHPLVLGDSSTLRVGEKIAAIGNPFGLSGSMTAGIVSQVGRLLPSSAGYSIPDVIQTDAAINPGNSGGPLLNMRGEVVGINNAIQSTSGEFAGVGFAIPSLTAVTVVPALIKDHAYSHPWIGISGRDMGFDTARLMGLDNAVGFLVVDVIENSPADLAGLLPSNNVAEINGQELRIGGDVILGVDGKDVREISDILLHLQRSTSVGDELVLDVFREGEMVKVYLTLQQRPMQ